MAANGEKLVKRKERLEARPGYVVIKPSDAMTTDGGLVLPDQVVKGWGIRRGELVTANEADGLEAGMVVMWAPGKASVFEFNGVPLWMCKADGVLAVVKAAK